MQGHGWADSGEQVNLAGIAELFFRSSGRGGLDEFSETRAGIGEAPGR